MFKLEDAGVGGRLGVDVTLLLFIKNSTSSMSIHLKIKCFGVGVLFTSGRFLPHSEHTETSRFWSKTVRSATRQGPLISIK